MFSKRIFNAAKEISWIGSGQLLTIIGGLFGVRILTNYLTPSQYGELSLGLSLGVMIYSVFLGSIANGSARFFNVAKSDNDGKNYFRAVFNINLKLFVLVIIFCILLFLTFLLLGYKEWIDLFIASLCFGLLYGFNNIANNINNASRKRNIVAFHKGLMTILRFSFAILIINFFGSSSSNAMYGKALGLFVVLLSQMFFLKKLIRENNSGKKNIKLTKYWESKLFEYAWPFIAMGFFTWLVTSIDRWALYFFASPVIIGLYAALYQIGYYPISILISLFTNYLEPIFYEKAGDGKDNYKIKSTYNLGMKINLIIIIFLILLVLFGFYGHKIIFGILLDSRYSSISYLLGPMMLASLLDGSIRFWTLLLQAKNETRSLIMPSFLADASRVALTIIGVYFYGLNGILFALIINAVLKFAWFYFLTRNKYKNL